MRQPISLTIPQPCHQSWAGMTPTTAGRHCAACEKTVVDFTLKTDAEILAFLAGAVSGRTCGRFAAGQLERPLQRAVLAAPTRWRAWLAAAVAVWGLHTAEGASAPFSNCTHTVPRPNGIEKPPKPVLKYLRGMVLDSSTQRPLAGVAVFLKDEDRWATTDSTGRFQLRLPVRPPRGGRTLVLHRTAYLSMTLPLAPRDLNSPVLILVLRPDPAATEVEVVGIETYYQRSIIMGMMPLPGTFVIQPKPVTPSIRWWQHLFRRN